MHLVNKYRILILLLIFPPAFCQGQGIGNFILNQSFGEGAINPGANLPVGITAYSFTPDSCLSKGTYTLTNSLFRCPATRMGRSIDNTPNSRDGYMMLINPPANKEMVVYQETIDEVLCPGTHYRFSAWMLNVAIPNNCTDNTILPKFLLTVETIAGVELQSAATGGLPYSYDMTFTPQFKSHAVEFMMPPGISQVVVKIKSLVYGGSCEIPVAIDDIQFAAKGPVALINFPGAVGQELVKQICFSENKTITFSGKVETFYPDTKYQWQESVDSGISWQDIPGATGTIYFKNFPVPDTFLYRLSAGDASNISNINCRVVSNILKVEVNDIPDDLDVTSNSPVCVGVDVRFDAKMEWAIAYEWHGPNGFYDNVYYPSVNHTELKDSGMYYVTVTTAGGCKYTDSTYVKVFGIGAVTAGNDTAICLGNTIQLHGSNGAKIVWSPGNSLSDSTISDPVAYPSKTTVYSIKVIDNVSCVSTGSIRVAVKNAVMVKAQIVGPDFVCRPKDTARFKGNNQGVLNQWNWDFRNGQFSNEETPQVITYQVNNNLDVFNVMLVVTDTAGCSDSAYHPIHVVDNCYMAVPSAFTPNGDGLNDFLYPVNAYKAKDLHFRVFHRNGQLVFQTRNRMNKWDGRINGFLQPTGVYIWSLEYTDENNKRVSLKGTTTLIR